MSKVICGTNTGEVVVFDSNAGFRSQRFQLGVVSIKNLSASENCLALVTNDNSIRVYFGGNYSMSLTCDNVASEPISSLVCVQNKASTQVLCDNPLVIEGGVRFGR